MPSCADVRIFYGSQTGAAEEASWDLVREGRRHGFPCMEPEPLNDLSLKELCNMTFVVFVVATTGQGDPPVNMRRFWLDLLPAALSTSLLKHVRFAVFGLGDSHYREFNYVARKLYARLMGLGAEPFFRLGLGDDQHDFGLEQELDPWAEGMWIALRGLQGPGPSTGDPGEEELRFEVEILDEQHDAQALRHSMRDGASALTTGFVAEALANIPLCSTEPACPSSQDARNVRLLPPPGVSFTAGDVCVVWPEADAQLVKRFVEETLGLSLGLLVRIRPHNRNSGRTHCAFPDEPLTLQEVFTFFVDVSAVPTRFFFPCFVFAHRARTSSEEVDRLCVPQS